jgi:hypothetical protein
MHRRFDDTDDANPRPLDFIDDVEDEWVPPPPPKYVHDTERGTPHGRENLDKHVRACTHCDA